MKAGGKRGGCLQTPGGLAVKSGRAKRGRSPAIRDRPIFRSTDSLHIVRPEEGRAAARLVNETAALASGALGAASCRNEADEIGRHGAPPRVPASVGARLLSGLSPRAGEERLTMLD